VLPLRQRGHFLPTSTSACLFYRHLVAGHAAVPDGWLGIGQQILADRRHADRRPNDQLRNSAGVFAAGRSHDRRFHADERYRHRAEKRLVYLPAADSVHYFMS
jgi:hypothetical protein